jgi:hypothetical protein
MTRSKLSTKVALLAAGIGLSVATFAGSASAQVYCPDGIYSPYYGCSDYGVYPYGSGAWSGFHRGFDHHGFGHGGFHAGFGHGMGGGFRGGGGGHR